MPEAIMVLGSPNEDDGTLPPIARSRCDEGYRLFRQDPTRYIICTGGIGPHFNRTDRPHGEYAIEYLRAKGVPQVSFLEVPKAFFTIEEAFLSKPILKRHRISKVSLTTSEFHMRRVQMIFGRVCPDIHIDYYPATTNLPAVELDALYAHERMAFGRDEATLDARLAHTD